MNAHVPVLLAEAMQALNPRPGGLYLDGTFGRGGYTRAILSTADTRVLALDRDPQAIASGAAMQREFGDRLILAQAEFAGMEGAAEAAGLASFDGIALDIGVSSPQIDDAARGFSFRNDGPLDMRMAQSGESAADIVNGASEARLADIIYHYGEERLARPVARAIVAARREAKIETTRALADIAAKVVWAKPGDIHPATRTFQGLRIAVNDELGELAAALHAAERLLKPGGRLAIVTFHSLEDRIVKQFFAARSGRGGGSRHRPAAEAAIATFALDGKWPVTAGSEELKANPRSRSAKLRAGIRNGNPPQPESAELRALAGLPEPRCGRRG